MKETRGALRYGLDEVGGGGTAAGRPELAEVRAVLREALARDGAEDLVELRYHAKTFRTVSVQMGALERSAARHRDGVAIRVLSGGTWGFAASSETSVAAVLRAIAQARAGARASAAWRREKVGTLSRDGLATGHFEVDGAGEEHTLEERIALAHELEARLRGSGGLVRTGTCTLNEIASEKVIITSDGADCSVRLRRPELRLSAVAERAGGRAQASESVGVTGGWSCLFRESGEVLADRAARTAVDLLSARTPEGGRAKVILSPSLVGLLVHEAVGHTVEADFVLSGSVAAGRLGTRVGSELVNLYDAGPSALQAGAGGTIPVDDEGVRTQVTPIIEAGILTGYLHNRETAARMGVAPTGNARAWEYSDPPLIRMRNTYLAPGTQDLAEIIESTADGWLLDGPRNGQADSTGEFMFGVVQARRIRGGKVGELVRGVTVTGLAFDVLQTVDAVSSEFSWALGSGHCGKGQPAKVDAGGPWIRCEATLAGEQH